MKTARTIPNAPFRNWSELKHGTLYDFVRARQDAIANRLDNFEQFQAYAVELAAIITQIAMVAENGFSDEARRNMPVLKKQTRRGIDKFGAVLKLWQEEILTDAERDRLQKATFVWQ